MGLRFRVQGLGSMVEWVEEGTQVRSCRGWRAQVQV
jgi:hypothetical protein